MFQVSLMHLLIWESCTSHFHDEVVAGSTLPVGMQQSMDIVLELSARFVSLAGTVIGRAGPVKLRKIGENIRAAVKNNYAIQGGHEAGERK